jgi:hypothetical protein
LNGTKIPPSLVVRLWEGLKQQQVRVERSYVTKGDAEAYLVPIADFLRDYRWFAERGLMCPETLVSDIEADLLAEMRQAVGTSDCSPTLLFQLGYPGSSSPIHFDWDFRTVFHVNLRGQKVFAVAPPVGGLTMPTLVNSIPFDLSSIDRSKQRSLLGLIDADLYQLGPGDGVVFPPLWWHAAIYQKPSLSLSFRFDEARDLRSIAALPRSAELQRLAWLIHSYREQIPIDTIGRIVDAFLTISGSWRTRHRRFLATLRQIENECRLGLGFPPANYGYPHHLLGIPDHVKTEMKRAYSLPEVGQPSDHAFAAEVEMIRSYLFEAGDAGISEALQVALASYACAIRIGRRN